MTHKAFLLILDGWGIGQKPEADAIFQANTPYFDSLWSKYPHSTLVTHGEDVGLPDGQMGNSEVGHLNIGAGRIIWQQLARINKAVRERELHQNKTLLDALDYAKLHGKTVHFMGLVSDGCLLYTSLPRPMIATQLLRFPKTAQPLLRMVTQR